MSYLYTTGYPGTNYQIFSHLYKFFYLSLLIKHLCFFYFVLLLLTKFTVSSRISGISMHRTFSLVFLIRSPHTPPSTYQENVGMEPNKDSFIPNLNTALEHDENMRYPSGQYLNICVRNLI